MDAPNPVSVTISSMRTRDDPHLDAAALATTLVDHWGIHPSSISFLPLGFDLDATVYDVVAVDGARLFLKFRAHWDRRAFPVSESGQLVARALVDAGVSEVVAPLPTRAGGLWAETALGTAILYPFVDGESAMADGMSDAHWVAFGRALRAVHDASLAPDLAAELPVEAFTLPAAVLVREVDAELDGPLLFDDTSSDFARRWHSHRDRIHAALARAEALGRDLRSRCLPRVLCHGDIHAANVLAGHDGRIHMVDWDGPLLAPAERDLILIVGSTIARTVTPTEEARFFDGYGSVVADPAVIAYFRYERFAQDLEACAEDVLRRPALSTETRQGSAEVAFGYFVPGGFLDRAEVITSHTPNLTLRDHPSA